MTSYQHKYVKELLKRTEKAEALLEKSNPILEDVAKWGRATGSYHEDLAKEILKELRNEQYQALIDNLPEWVKYKQNNPITPPTPEGQADDGTRTPTN